MIMSYEMLLGVAPNCFRYAREKVLYSEKPLSNAAFVTGIPSEIRVRAMRSRLFTI